MPKTTQELIQSMQDAVLRGPATTPTGLREAVAARAAAPPGQGPEVPKSLEAYIDKVAHAAHKVTDEEVEALRHLGLNDDALFELTVAAAVGAGLARLDAGRTALKGDPNP